MIMLEKTDNDLPKANDENVSEESSIPNAKKEDETTEKPTQPPVEAVTEEQAEKVAPAPEKKQEETVEAAEEPVEAVQDASETVEEAETESKKMLQLKLNVQSKCLTVWNPRKCWNISPKHWATNPFKV